MFKMKSLWVIAVLVCAATVAMAQSHHQGQRGGAGNAGGKITPTTGDAGMAVCFGDGTGTKCPVNNPGRPGHGCDNSTGMGGALLRATGFPCVSEDSVLLSVRGLPLGTTVIYMQAAKLALKPYVFGDGLMCMGSPDTHLANKNSIDSTSRYPEFGEPTPSQSGKIPTAGATVYYQVLYRDRYLGSVHSNFNLSNAWCTTWMP
jgi:hypothetical protein